MGGVNGTPAIGPCPHRTLLASLHGPNYPWKIVQTPGLTVILFENFTQDRQIFTDGRDYPTERQPTWFGYSLGHWDGDIFVIETLGFNDKSCFLSSYVVLAGLPSIERDKGAGPSAMTTGSDSCVLLAGSANVAEAVERKAVTPNRAR